MRELRLTQGKRCLLDDDDYYWITSDKWCAHKKENLKYYVSRYTPIDGNGKRKFLYIHRVIFQKHYGRIPNGYEIDHIDGNGLNNQKNNLRLATHSQNLYNTTLGSQNTSGFKGVSRPKKRRRWEARIRINKKQIYLGSFLDKEQAARVYQEAERIYHGIFTPMSNE